MLWDSDPSGAVFLCTNWWLKDLTILRIDMFQRVLTVLECRGDYPEYIDVSLVNYAAKELTQLQLVEFI